MNVSLIIELVIILAALIFMLTDKREQKIQKLGNAFIWLSVLGVVFCIVYVLYLFGVMSSFPTWTPVDFLSIAMACYLITTFIPMFRICKE